ncbi:extracellular solute-binding protein [Alsobacter sp. SYSU M60028]|uniref:Extracellular solute-binding protein n=1 Tax=Alsobacter ponti TaxID=2962936 RepID=A0ABT1L9K1_9HYPH|nr:extracellular solute-binding protein [Alsobacter ponti]MCP8937415.1 extracellular solute-binding protein [Alsobacter ponti]
MHAKFTVAAAALLLTVAHASAIELKVLVPAQYSPASGFIPGSVVHKDLYAKFEAQNPDIKLNYEVLDTGPQGLQKILTQATTNSLPDAAIVDGQWIARLVQAKALQPLDQLWPASDRADFHPAVVEAVSIDGKPYAIMFQTGMRGLLYRPSVLAAQGEKEFPKTFDDFLKLASKLKDKKVVAELVPAKATDEPSTMHMLSIFWGLGGKLVDEHGAPVFFTEENGKALARVYEMYRDLVAKGAMRAEVTTMDEAALRPFFYGHEVFAMGGSSSNVKQIWSEQPDTVNDLAVAAYPMPGSGKPVTILGGFTYAITARDPKKVEAAWKFVSFMTAPAQMGAINEALGQLPVRTSVWSTNGFFSTNPMMVSYKAMYDGPMQTRPVAPIYTTISSAISSQLPGVIAGTLSPSDAVNRARDAVMVEFKRQQSR